MARSGGEEVMVAFEQAGTRVRSLTQGFGTWRGDGASQEERRKLFQNGVWWWLLEVGVCGPTDLGLEMTVSEERVKVGERFIYTLNAIHGGECAGTGVRLVNRLPAGLKYVTAESTRGTPSEADGIVSFEMGYWGSAQQGEVRLEVQAVSAGVWTNTATIYNGGSEVRMDNNSAQAVVLVEGGMEPEMGPHLGIRFQNGKPLLDFQGAVGKRYVIETAIELGNWTMLTEVVGAGTTSVLVDPNPGNSTTRFYRAVIR